MKRIFKIIALGVCLGLCLAAVQQGLGIDKDQFLRVYWIIAPAIVLGAVAFNAAYNISYQRKMRRLVPLLDEGRAEDYTAGVEALLQTARGRSLRNILTINLAAGYMEADAFDRALALLEPLCQERLQGSVIRMCHRLNLCMCYFYTGQSEKALALYQSGQPLFRPYREKEPYGGSIAAAEILAAIAGEQYGQAAELLARARRDWTAPRMQASFGRIENLLAETGGRRGGRGLLP